MAKKGQEPKPQQQQPADVTRGPKTMTGKEEERSTAAASAAAAVGDTLYLCNFRVSVDGDWLCLKELGGSDMDLAGSSAAGLSPPAPPPKGKWTPTTPEFEQMVRYPTYPVGRTGTEPSGGHTVGLVD